MSFSFSKVDTYLTCPQKYKFKYVDKIKMDMEQSPQIKRGLAIHKIFEDAINGHDVKLEETFIPKTVGDFISKLVVKETMAEVALGVTKDMKPSNFQDGYVRGILDVVQMPFRGVPVITDIKTGSINKNSKVVYYEAAQKHLKQLQLYADLLYVVLGESFGFKEVFVRAYYVDAVDPWGQSWAVNVTELAHLKRFIRVCKTIEDRPRTEPTPHRFCPWCEYSKTNGGPCPAA